MQGVLKLQQAGADLVPVVSAERLLPHCLSCVSGVYLMVVEGRDDVVPLCAGVLQGG